MVLGLAYKKDIDDPRESPSFRLIELLEEKGAIVDYNDPYINESPKMRNHNVKKKSIPLTEENIKKYDVLLIATDHSSYDQDFLLKHAKLIVDTRNLIKTKNDKVIKA